MLAAIIQSAGASASLWLPGAKMPFGEIEKGFPVGREGHMSSAVIIERQVSSGYRSVERR